MFQLKYIHLCIYNRSFEFNTLSRVPITLNLTGDMMNLYTCIQRLLEWPFSELFSPNESLWNQYKYIAFNIFSCRILIILYKMLVITAISNEKNKWINHIWNIMLKRHNTLPTRTTFFISSAGKSKIVQEFKLKLFE